MDIVIERLTNLEDHVKTMREENIKWKQAINKTIEEFGKRFNLLEIRIADCVCQGGTERSTSPILSQHQPEPVSFSIEGAPPMKKEEATRDDSSTPNIDCERSSSPELNLHLSESDADESVVNLNFDGCEVTHQVGNNETDNGSLMTAVNEKLPSQSCTTRSNYRKMPDNLSGPFKLRSIPLRNRVASPAEANVQCGNSVEQHDDETAAVVEHVQLSRPKLRRRQDGKYNCSYSGCKYQSSHHSSVLRHLVIHTGEKKYLCHHCDKSFGRKASLKRHSFVHIPKIEWPFHCKQCDGSFLSRNDLDDHIRIHTGEKPLKCDQCDKQFRTIQLLHAHWSVHAKAFPFACPSCDKRFSYEGNMLRHNSLVHLKLPT